jgi:ABC-type amino acid transport substrate-binding protein
VRDLVALCLLTLAWAGALVAAPSTDGSTVAESGPQRISVAYCIDCVPFHFSDPQGEPAGMIVDIWRLWSKKTGIAIDFKPAQWQETLRMVGDGEADVHAGLFFNEERDRFLDYGVALRRTDTHVFLHRSLPDISSIEELAAYRIGVLAGDYVESYLKERLPAEVVVAYPSYEAILEALQKGGIRAFAADTPTGVFHLQQVGLLAEYKFPPSQLLYQNDWFLAVQEGNGSLLEVLDEGMARISEEERRAVGRHWTVSSGSEEEALIIAVDRGYPPLSLMNAQGRPAGLLVDLWRLWSAKTGRRRPDARSGSV